MTSEDVSKMIVEIVTAKPRTITGLEAEAMYAMLEHEIAEIQEQGYDVEVSSDITEDEVVAAAEGDDDDALVIEEDDEDEDTDDDDDEEDDDEEETDFD
jgi:spoIIIJ-associated protein